MNRLRDETEIALVHAAREAGKPVLAICRGPQLLNVALGGTLIQDIPSQVPDAIPHDVRDDIATFAHARSDTSTPGSRIAKAVGATRIAVNSLHHQSILDVAPRLAQSRRARQTESSKAVESEGNEWWVIAVQWHPEEMNDSPEPWDRGIFRAFAARLDEG